MRQVIEHKVNKSKLFTKAKESAIKYLEKYYGEKIDKYDNQKLDRVVNLKDFPTDNTQLHRVPASAKAIILKAHLKELYPETKFSVVKPHYGSLYVRYLEGVYPWGLGKIQKLYVNPGNTDSLTDYYDYDLHMLLINDKSGDQHFYDDADEAIKQLDKMIARKMESRKDYYDKAINYLVELVGVKA